MVIGENKLAPVDKNSTKRFKQATRVVKSLDQKQMKDHGDALFAAKVANEDQLVAALDSGVLKSEKLVKQAKALKAAREKAAKAKEAKEKAKATPAK